MNTIICPKCKFEFLPETRSLSLNSYLHAIFSAIAKEIGNVSIEQVKHDVMFAVGATEFSANCITGEEMLYRKETSKMSNKDCAELTESVRHWAKDFLGLIIPDADGYKQGELPTKIEI